MSFYHPAFGVTGRDGESVKKSWKVVSSNFKLAKNLSFHKYDHDNHAPLEGTSTRQFAFYPRPMNKFILESRFYFVSNCHVPLMHDMSIENRNHVLRLKPAWTLVLIEVNDNGVGIINPWYGLETTQPC